MIDALPLEWRGKLKSSAWGICNETFVIQDQCKLILNSEIVQIKSVVPKVITKKLRSRVITTPTAQLRFNLVLFRDSLLPRSENGPEPRPLFPPGFRPILRAG